MLFYVLVGYTFGFIAKLSSFMLNSLKKRGFQMIGAYWSSPRIYSPACLMLPLRLLLPARTLTSARLPSLAPFLRRRFRVLLAQPSGEGSCPTGRLRRLRRARLRRGGQRVYVSALPRLRPGGLHPQPWAKRLGGCLTSRRLVPGSTAHAQRRLPCALTAGAGEPGARRPAKRRCRAGMEGQGAGGEDPPGKGTPRRGGSGGGRPSEEESKNKPKLVSAEGGRASLAGSDVMGKRVKATFCKS